ncbi:MAG: transglutaminase TgpA family protein [Oscillochloridaceae bacterium umkhey_bin13]
MTTTSPSLRQAPPRDLARELSELLPGALLILLMSGAVIWSLATSGWAPGLAILRPIGLLGLLTGIVFARLPWLPAWLAHSLSAALGLTWTIQALGSLMDDRLSTWRDQAADLVLRGIIWGRVIASGGRGEDILLFVFVLGLLVWSLAYSTAWMVLRRGWAWRPIILNAALALINYTYVLPKPTAAFFIFLCAALLLLVYQHVLARQSAWDAQRIEYPDLLPVRFLASAALVCGSLILLTAFLPGQVSVDRATQTWTTLSSPFRQAREQWEDLFSTINAPPGAGSGAFTTATASLGGARQLSAEVVMEVRSTAYDYWRATAFDRYTGEGWQNTVGEQARAALGTSTREQARTPREAEEPIPIGDQFGRRPVVQEFTLLQDRLDDLIMVGGSASQISLPTLVEHNYVEQGGAARPNFDETAAILATQRLRSGQTYTVTALVSFANVAGLRAAGTDYPVWVRERYLQLPDVISDRTRDLAANLIAEAGATTPYDSALAIQNYLRTIPYNENIAAPPAGREHVDWFLFEQREGYCDYFASAMVVMLRSQGIPARWVRGYAGGEFDVDRAIYLVRENVAHSWPEVYFPGYGWERFEPTPASYTALPLRPLTGALGVDQSELGPLASGPLSDPRRFEDELDEGLLPEPSTVIIPTAPATGSGLDLGRPLAILAAMIGGLGLLATLIYGRWRYELQGLSQAGEAFAGMALLASLSGLRHDPHRTPTEHAAMLAAALPDHRPTIERIALAFAQEQYGGQATRPAQLYQRSRSQLPTNDDREALYRALLRRVVVRERA